MINIDFIIDETFQGTIGNRLAEIAAIPTFNNRKKALVQELIQACDDENYLAFDSFSHHFHSSKIGHSFLYDLPSNTRGRLKIFAGSRVRVICVGSGQRWARRYAVGKI